MSRDRALQVVRDDERLALAHLSGEPTRLAYTRTAISRELFKLIEPPPTRHRTYVIQTIWDYDTKTAERHVILAGGHPVSGYRPGPFGGGR